ncbi:exosome nuclease subunit, partial [Ascosphaera aggregata]
KSLKYLLEKFVNFQAEKQYQMADWRLRPLLPGMFDYARSDTHYLLYIYDLIRNELLEKSDAEKSLVDYVLEKSKEESLQRFERPTYDVETGKGTVGWYDLLLKTSVLFSKEQFAVFRAVHRWRDEVARAEDEGLQYVLAKHALFRIAHSMPIDAVSLLRAAAPVSPVVRAHVLELVELIKQAKIEGLNGVELRDVLHPIGHGGGVGAATATAAAETKPMEATAATTAHAGASEVASRIGIPVVDRAESSQFWGTHFHGPEPSLINFHSIDSAIEAFFLSLPMPAKPIDAAAAAATDDDAAVAAGAGAAVGAAGFAAEVEIRAPAATLATSNGLGTSEEPLEEQPNEIFTVKSFSSSKKRKHEDSSEEASLEPSSTSPVEQQQQQQQQQQQGQQEQQEQASTTRQIKEVPTEGAAIQAIAPSSRTSKNQRKRRRQAEKRLARQQLELQKRENGGKAAQQQQQVSSANNETTAAASRPAAEASTVTSASAVGPTAFDYTKAESVLHAATPPASSSLTGGSQQQQNKSKKKNKNKSFNPYVKATNTSTGLGRIKRDTTGKSHTFR